MKWIGDANHDTCLLLTDDSGGAILGKLVLQKDSVAGDSWQAHDYFCDLGKGKELGVFTSANSGKDAVEVSVERSMAK